MEERGEGERERAGIFHKGGFKRKGAWEKYVKQTCLSCEWLFFLKEI